MPDTAITFDLWDTLVADDSDEPRRAALGLPTKAQARLDAVTRWLTAGPEPLAPDAIRAAWTATTDDFRRAWKVEHHTPGVRWRLERLAGHLGVAPPPGVPAVVAALERMEADLPPDPAPGVRPMLEALHGRYPLAIVSDAIVTPGRLLRAVLNKHGLAHFFDAFIFSDEAGASKPAPAVFEQATAALSVAPTAFVHVGDREETDVAGALAGGGLGVLYTGVVDRGHTESTRAHGVCDHHDHLPDLIDRLVAQRERA